MLRSIPALNFPVGARIRSLPQFRSFEPVRLDEELARTGQSFEGARTRLASDIRDGAIDREILRPLQSQKAAADVFLQHDRPKIPLGLVVRHGTNGPQIGIETQHGLTLRGFIGKISTRSGKKLPAKKTLALAPTLT